MEMDPGSSCSQSKTHTAAVHVFSFPQLTAYRSASCYITIAFLTMLFTPLAWEKIAPLWVLHHSGTLMSAQMDFQKLTFSKSLGSFAKYNLEVPTAEINCNSKASCLVRFSCISLHKIPQNYTCKMLLNQSLNVCNRSNVMVFSCAHKNRS